MFQFQITFFINSSKHLSFYEYFKNLTTRLELFKALGRINKQVSKVKNKSAKNYQKKISAILK